MKKIKLAFVFLAVIVIGGGLWWFFGTDSPEPSTDIVASGFIEAKEVAVAAEAGGRIVNITVKEGDKVAAGMLLLQLDDSLLQAQQQQLEANIALAQASLEQTLASRDHAVASAEGAEKAWENSLDMQANPLELEARIIVAQGELDMAELAVTRAWRSSSFWGVWEQRTAELQRDVAREVLGNLLLIRDNPQEIDAAVDKACTTYHTALVAVEVAGKAVEVAESGVAQAEAALNVIKVQVSKLTLGSPISGVVAAQYAEVGEIAQPGAPILTITQLAEVTLTAYVSESKIGLVKLGQEALVLVDAYPGDNFSGEVVYISPRALFTPKNIQMKEEREKMVFAVKVRLPNPEQKLKPGMPTDARILVNAGG